MTDAGLRGTRATWSTENLDALRERQREAGEKARYDRHMAPGAGKTLPAAAGVEPVLLSRNPLKQV